MSRIKRLLGLEKKWSLKFWSKTGCVFVEMEIFSSFVAAGLALNELTQAGILGIVEKI